MMKAIESDSAFTLIEVLVSLTILVVLFSLSFAFLDGLVRTTRSIDDQRDSRLIAGNILTRFTRELQMLSTRGRTLLPAEDVCGTNKSNPSPNYIIGIDSQSSSQFPADAIEFVARQAGQHFLEGGGIAGPVQIRYFLSQNRSSGETVLVREERPNIRPCESAHERAMRFPISNRVRGLNFEFYDEEELEWREDWPESPERRTPSMVRFSFDIEDARGIIHSFSSAVSIQGVES